VFRQMVDGYFLSLRPRWPSLTVIAETACDYDAARGAYMMTPTPTKQMRAPMTS
jgi:hypothetical protein